MNRQIPGVYGDPYLDRTNKLFSISSLVYILLIVSIVYHPLVFYPFQRFIRFPLVFISLLVLAATVLLNADVKRYYMGELKGRMAELIFAFLWGLTIVIEILLKRSNNIIDNSILQSFAWGMVMYAVGLYHGHSIRSIVRWSFIILLACAVTTGLSIRDIMDNPYVIRLNTVYLNNNEAEKVVISAGTWLQITTMSIVSVIWIAVIFHIRSIILSLLAAAMLGLLYYAILVVTLSSIVMYIIIACIIMTVYLVFYLKKQYALRFCIFGVILIALVAIMLRSSVSYYVFDDAWSKLTRIVVGVAQSGREGDETGRGSTLINYTLNSIAKSPIIGNGTSESNTFTAGGHAHFIDVIAWYGVIGAIPIYGFTICMYWRCAKSWFKHKHELMLFGILVCAAIYFIQGLVGGILLPYMTTLVYYFLAMPSVNENPPPQFMPRMPNKQNT